MADLGNILAAMIGMTITAEDYGDKALTIKVPVLAALCKVAKAADEATEAIETGVVMDVHPLNNALADLNAALRDDADREAGR